MSTDFNQPGRQWIVSPAETIPIIPGLVKKPAIVQKLCQRCGSQAAGLLPNRKSYCRVCLGLGRVVEGDWLVQNLEVKKWPQIEHACTWQGQLTPQQKQVAQSLVESLQAGQSHLVEAVTGAGKTEMLFPAITWALAHGLRIAVATPRVDVAIELYPRLQAAFTCILGLRHGRTAPPSREPQLLVCTTHQLLKYIRAFDLLIIDEVDAFPFQNNQPLQFGAKQAVRQQGCIFYLTATPPAKLLKRAKQHELGYSSLHRRFHGYNLPVPRVYYCSRQQLKQLCPSIIKQTLTKAQQAGKQVLVFLPRIEQLPAYLTAYQKAFPDLRLASVSAEDPERLAKIEAFRVKQIDVLLTTTILERGVTFKSVWVIVWQAEDAIYQTASLVQIAGRVGRSADDPTGLVLFCYHCYTRYLRQTIRQIRRLNR
ncbi:MAG: DEAD/DEAH box helicase [Lactobacillus sp.]|jgi:competence protein ComFA|nr:DEAD/DEAH box helicase [Lactobacillus sp.]MCH3906597.1 DEAD/DEAH box helicase [Lactobacillus sp.]MCH3989767.1 DEAD/DEAH box helicase [Lactobacillus sp.]MCH4068067.1 DEAD/DEAH box helicase [Lactobacillus sp.]MCI1303977.1 DEAD/DEAH box helicase [Lactobacillus sp.]